MQTGFLKPDGTIVKMEYYEVEKYCINEVAKYVEQSSENRDLFNKFSQNYSYFRPYFDFVVFEMQYIFLNPLYQSGQFGFQYNNGKTIDLSETTKTNMYRSKPVDDYTLGISLLNIPCEKPSIVTNDGILFDKENYSAHFFLMSHILNQILISDKYFCDDYQKIGRVAPYLVNRLGFLWYGLYDEDNMILTYTPSLTSENQRPFINYLHEYYPSPRCYVENRISDGQHKESKQLILRYENSFKYVKSESSLCK